MGVEYVARDMQKKQVADYRWVKNNCTRITIKVRNDSGIPDGLERMSQSIGTSNNAYIVEALAEKLRRDGYLQD